MTYRHSYDFWPTSDQHDDGPLPLDLDIEDGTPGEDPAEPLAIYPESEEWRESTRRLQLVDLGPSDTRFDRTLGPDAAWEERVFAEAANPKYIETRTPRGVHCMDDRNTQPGIQLPGGIIEMKLAARFMDPDAPELPVSQVYPEVIEELRQEDWWMWMHGLKCAAMAFKREALAIAFHYSSSASDFNHEVMGALQIPYDQDEYFTILATGAQRARNRQLWDMSAETSLRVNTQYRGVNREDYQEDHRAAGFRIDTTSNLFNNEEFRKDHNGVGLLSVTPGAYRDALRSHGVAEAQVAREMMYHNVFAFGLAKAVGHQYLLAGIVKE